MATVLGSVLMAAITLPVSFFVARACLRGVIRLLPSALAAPPPGGSTES